jgi:hypothetical protein
MEFLATLRSLPSTIPCPECCMTSSTLSAKIAGLRSTVKNFEDMDELPPDFDFSRFEPNKFHQNAVIHFPVYLDPEVLRYFSKKAHDQHLNTQDLLNQILEREMGEISPTTG